MKARRIVFFAGLATVLSFLAFAAQPALAAPFLNGDFESNVAHVSSPWQALSIGLWGTNEAPSGTDPVAYLGTRYAELGNPGSAAGGIYQTFDTVPGVTYSVSLWGSGWTGYPNHTAYFAVGSGTWNGSVTTGTVTGVPQDELTQQTLSINRNAVDGVTGVVDGWNQFSGYSFTANSAISTITFWNNNGSAARVDNILVTARTTWTGTGANSNWSTAANWTGGLPGSATGAVFDTLNTSNSNDLPASTQIKGLSFSSTAGAFTLVGNDVNLTGDVTNSGANLQTIGLNLVLDGTRTCNFYTAAGNVLVSGNISQAAGQTNGLTKTGTAVLTLSGTNSYSGGTTFLGGEVSVAADSSLGASSGSLGFNGGLLQVTGAAFSSTPRTITVGASGGGFDIQNAGTTFTVSQNLTGSGRLAKAGAGTMILSGSGNTQGGVALSAGVLYIANSAAVGAGGLTLTGGTFDITTGAPLTLPNAAQNWGGPFTFLGSQNLDTGPGALTISANAGANVSNGTLTVSGPISSTGPALTKTGTGTLVIRSTGNNLTGASNINVDGGTLKFSGTGSLASCIQVGNAAGAIGTLNINSATNLTIAGANGSVAGAANGLNTGDSAGAVGVINMTGGTVSLTNGGWNMTLGDNATGTGYFNMSGGSLKGNEFEIGNYGWGYYNQSGGTFQVNNWFLWARNSGTAFGVVNVTGGQLISPNAGLNCYIWGGYGGDLDVSGSGIVNLGPNSMWTAHGGRGVANLLTGGTIALLGIGANTSGAFNFNGGTLMPTGSNTNFLAVPHVYVYPSGANINTNGQNITIGQALLAPTGSGFSSISVTGSGYTSPPLVYISGGAGSYASGVATIDANGNLTGVTITNPGVNYTSTGTITLYGGGGTYTVTGATLAANSSGGLHVNGGGNLTLTNLGNTYSGGTTVNSGTLTIGVQGSNAQSAVGGANPVTVNSGAMLRLAATDGLGYYAANPNTLAINGGVLTIASSIHAGLGYNGVSLTAGTIASDGAGDGSGNYLLDGTVSTLPSLSPSVISAQTVGLRGGNGGNGLSVTFNVSKGTTATDLLVSSALIDGNAGNGLIKSGPGSMQLSGSLAYTGATTVNQGLLQLEGSAISPAMSNLTVGSSGVLGFTAGAASTLNLSGNALTLSGGTVNFDIGAAGVNDTINVGTLNLTASSQFDFNAIGALSTASTYTLLTSTNPINAGSFTVSGQQLGKLTLTPVINTNTITLAPVLAQGIWNIAGSGNWSLGNSASTGGNWLNYRPTVAGDAALFGRALLSSARIKVDSPFALAFMTFDNPTASYTIGTPGSSNLTLDNGAATAIIAVNSGVHTIAENTTLNSNVTIAPSASTALTISGNLSGVGNVLMAGGGTLTLAGANAQTGGVTITAGQLNLNSAAALGATVGAFTVNGGTLDNTSGAPVTIVNNNPQNWGADVNFLGSNNLNLGTGAVTLAGSRNVTVVNSTLTVGGNIGDGGNIYSLTKSGPGALSLAGSSTFSGGVTLSAGRLNINGPASLGTGTFTVNSGTIDNTSGSPVTNTANNPQTWAADVNFLGSNNLNLGSGAVTLGSSRTVTVNSSTLTVGGSIGDGGNGYSLGKAGAGALTLAGSNTYAGATILNAGVLNVNNAAALSTGTLVLNGGTLGNTSGAAVTIANNNPQTWAGDFGFAGPNNLNLGSGAVTLTGSRTVTVNSNNTLTVGGVIDDGAGTYGLTKAGPGVLVLSNSANSYKGPTVISGGTLQLLGAAAVPNSDLAYTFATGAAFNSGTMSVTTNPINSPAFTASGGPKPGLGYMTVTGNNFLDITPTSGNLTNLGGGASYTIGMWINTTYAGASFLSKGETTGWGYHDECFYLTGSTGNAGAGGGGHVGGVQHSGGWVGSNTNVNDGHWHFISLVRSANNTTVYVDGNVDASSNPGMAAPEQGTQDIRIGGTFGSDGWRTFVGEISGAYVYSSALSAAQIQNLMNLGAGGAQSANLPATTAVNITTAGATLDLEGNVQSIASLAGVANSQVLLGNGGALTVGTDNSNTEFDGVISGAGSLTKTGSGTLTLNGTNNYTGGTIVLEGTLALDTPAAIVDGTSLTVGDPASFIPAPIVAGAESAAVVSPVPEPGTLALLALGTCSAAAYCRLRRRRLRKGASLF